MEPARYFAQCRGARFSPGQLPSAIGVQSEDGRPRMPIGVAFQVGRIGQGRKAEAVWRLKVGDQDLDGRWALRAGRFVGLAEDAE